MPKTAYFLDGLLVSRIKQVLRDHKGIPSVSYLTEELQSKYGVYARKKRNALMKSVEKGFPIALKQLQEEGIQISTNDSSSDSEASSEVDRHNDIMNSMINSMYRQGRPATPTSGNKVTNSTQITPVSSSVDSRASKLSGAHAELTDLQGTEPLNLCTDKRSSTNSSAEEMELDVSHNNIVHLATGNSDMGLVEGHHLNGKTGANEGSDKSERPRKRRRESPDGSKEKRQMQLFYPDVNFSDVGGNDHILQRLQHMFGFLKYHEFVQYSKFLGRSLLLHGPPGCGKTLLAHALAGEYKLPLLSVTSTELIGGISGDSEANIRDLFEQAAELAPCVLFIDDIDAIAIKREMSTKSMDVRIVTQLVDSIKCLKVKNVPVLIVCATNSLDSIDQRFRNTTCFDKEFAMRYPDRDARKSILQTLCKEQRLAGDVSLSDIAALTPGYIGDDLRALIAFTCSFALYRFTSELEMQASNKVMDYDKRYEGSRRPKVSISPEEIKKFMPLPLTMADFKEAMAEVKPTAKQDDVILAPDTTWSDIGGLDPIREELKLLILGRQKNPELYKTIDALPRAGVLLVGPPGCGKTSIAKAFANEAGINLMYIKGASLLNKYVGQSERNVIELFQRAANLAPCVMFFDEFDALCPKSSDGSHDGLTERVVSHMLLEMSGSDPRNEVYVMGATNTLHKIDPRIIRAGRMGTLIYVGLPSPEGRVDILRALTKNGTKPKLADDVDLDYIGKDSRCNGFSGADLEELVNAAKCALLREICKDTGGSFQTLTEPVINKSHFESALDTVPPSVNKKDMRYYESVRRDLESRKARQNTAGTCADSKADVRSSMDERSSCRQCRDRYKRAMRRRRELHPKKIGRRGNRLRLQQQAL